MPPSPLFRHPSTGMCHPLHSTFHNSVFKEQSHLYWNPKTAVQSLRREHWRLRVIILMTHLYTFRQPLLLTSCCYVLVLLRVHVINKYISMVGDLANMRFRNIKNWSQNQASTNWIGAWEPRSLSRNVPGLRKIQTLTVAFMIFLCLIGTDQM